MRGQLAGQGCQLRGWGLDPGKKGAFQSLACLWVTPTPRPALSPAPPHLWALQLTVLLMAPVWPRSLRMLKGTSTQPASRPRAPQRPPRRTGLTCTSCRSLRSPCPWPSSPGVQVCESPGAPVSGGGCGSG